VKKSTGRVDGFVVERPTAGGHNAPPRGLLQLGASGEPVYGPKDDVDLSQMKELGLPFWVGGSCAAPETLRELRAQGAAGVQVGTLFAFCEESGLAEDLKREVRRMAVRGEGRIFTDPLASPTRFPFKVVRLGGTISEKEVYEARTRICDMGYLREAYRREDGTLGYRCPSEPAEDYVKKGGRPEETQGRKCLCNGLLANIGHPQVRKDGRRELPLLTSGDDINRIARFLAEGKESYTAGEVVRYLVEEGD